MDSTPSAPSGDPDPVSAAPEGGAVRIQLLEGAALPYRAHAHDAGADLISSEDLVLAPGERALVGTGIRLALPEGTVGMVCPRSGLAMRHGITVLNGPGIVDAGYRGEVRVPLLNTDREQPFAIRRGDRIAQLVIVPFLAPALTVVDELDATDRAEGGFGSSGGFGAPADASAPSHKE